MAVFDSMKRRLQWSTLAVAAALALAACGGGDDATPRTTAVRVAGDSLADSGTFGYKFTVQPAAGQAAYAIWTDVIASGVKAPALCARYTMSATGLPVLNAAAATCTSHGVGGATINPPGNTLDATPMSVVQQLKDLAAGGAYGAEELLLVDGGGNDAAALVSAFLRAGPGATSDGGASYVALLGEVLSPTQVGAAVAGGQVGLVNGGAQYMVALANMLADAINTQALDKGAKRVVVVNVPNINLTPRFKNLLAAVATLAGGGAAGQAQADGVAAVSEGWVIAFNAQLASRFSGESKVAVVDFYTAFDQWVKAPATYGFTNTTKPACPATGVDTNGLPTYDFKGCVDAQLSAAPPAGETGANWWQTYFFSDHFHGTPKANQAMGDVVLAKLKEKGWN